MALFPSKISYDAIKSVTIASKTDKLKKKAKKVYPKLKKCYETCLAFKEESGYTGGGFGKIEYTVSQKLQDDPKKTTLLAEQNIEEKAQDILEKLFLYDASSKNTLKLFVTKFRVRSKATKLLFGNLATGPDVLTIMMSLRAENGNQDAIIEVGSAKLMANQYTDGVVGLTRDAMRNLYATLACVKQ